MPTYEYRCKNCGEHIEIVQSFKDDPLTECPACSGPLRKVFAPVGIVLKGSGFYRTDNRSGGSKSPTKETSSESKTESKDSKADAKADSKSESKSESKSKDKKTESKSA